MNTDNIKIGDLVKIEQENRVFQVCGFSKGHKHIPDGWYMEVDGGYVNPKFCKKYELANSVINI